MKKGYMEFSFAWLFAIIVGAFILFIAIYASVKVIDTGKTSQSAQTGKEIGILLNPLETGFERGVVNSISIPIETRIHNLCDSESSNFGKQGIKVSQKSFGDWTETDLQTDFENKYIFSEKTIEGKKFYLFSKPFDFPYKVSDLIYMSGSEDFYCFIDAPEKIKRELDLLGQENIKTECSESEIDNSINVCFSNQRCEIRVDYNENKVFKQGKTMEFQKDSEDEETLMYAAIFSDPEIYECQLKRLINRMKVLAILYSEKSRVIAKHGCPSDSDLNRLLIAANRYENSANLFHLSGIVEEVNQKNDLSRCKLW